MGQIKNSSGWADDTQRRTLHRILQMVGLLRDRDKEMPAQQMQVLFFIALHDVSTQRDMFRDLAMPVSTASRNIAALSQVHRLGKHGVGLVSLVENAQDRRSKLLALTPKDRTCMRKIIDAA